MSDRRLTELLADLDGAGADVSAPADGAAAGADDAAAAVVASAERLGELIETLEQHPDGSVTAAVDELLRVFDGLHRVALTRLAGLLEQHALLSHACADEVIGMLFELYELAPSGEAGGAAAAGPGAGAPAGGSSVAASAPGRPAPAAHPAPAEPGLIRLQDIRRIPRAETPPTATATPTPPRASHEGADAGRTSTSALPPRAAAPGRSAKPGSAATAAEPSSTSYPTSGPAGSPLRPGGTPTPDSATPRPPGKRWTELARSDELPPGERRVVADGQVLLVNVEGTVHAVRNRCGASPLPLHVGDLVGGRVICSWHKRCEYDLVSGESTSGRRTLVYPTRRRGTRISVALEEGTSTGPLQPANLRAAPM